MPRSFLSWFACLALTLAACRPSADKSQSAAADTASANETATAPVRPAAPIDVAALDSTIRAYVAAKHLVGLSVGVAQGDKLVFARGYGVASLATHDSVTPQTMFAIGSVTKQFTCSLALLLQQDGKLSMSDRVSKYYPKLTRAGDITLLDLGQHVSGYRDYYPLDFVDREMAKPTTADAIINEYATRPLDFDPGTRWSYSNTNFIILGRVIEMAGGAPYATQLSQRILTPLGMSHTRFDPSRTGSDSAHMATGYTTFALSGPVPATPEADGWAGTAGALWSTPSDLLAWDLGLVDGKVLSPASYHTLTTARRLADGRSTGYGCGDGVNDRGEAIVLSHGGAVSGFVAQNTVIPTTRSAVVLLANTDFAALGDLHNEIVAKLMPHVDVPTVNGPPALRAASALLTQLQRGTVDRATLGDDYNAYLTPERVASAHRTLAGPITGVTLLHTAERGGMEVTVFGLKVGARPAQALMYRTPDGKIQEFEVSAP